MNIVFKIERFDERDSASNHRQALGGNISHSKNNYAEAGITDFRVVDLFTTTELKHTLDAQYFLA